MEQDVGNLQDPDDYERWTGQRIDLDDAESEDEPRTERETERSTNAVHDYIDLGSPGSEDCEDKRR